MTTTYYFALVNVNNGSLDTSKEVKRFDLGVAGFLDALSEIGIVRDRNTQERAVVLVSEFGDFDAFVSDVVFIEATGKFRNGVSVPKAIVKLISKSFHRASGAYASARGWRTSRPVADGLLVNEKTSKKISTN